MISKRLIFRTFMAILLIVASLSLNSQTKTPLDPSVKKGVLSNGMTYYIKHNARPEKRAELRLAVKVGSVVEDDDQKGLAHFCEHMAFNGTKSFPRQDLVNYVESIGMGFGPDLNAYTSYDQTVYMLKVPTDNRETLLKGLKIIEEWGTSVSYENPEIDKERGVISEEHRLYRGAESRIALKQMPISYYKSKYAERDVIGDTNIIGKAPYAALKRFYSDWYRPDLMAVLVVGDIDVDDIEKIIKENFSKYTNPTNERKREIYPVPFHDDVLVSVETDKELSFPSVEFTILHDKIDKSITENMKKLITQSLAYSIISNRLNEYVSKPNPPFQYAYTYYADYEGDKDAFKAVAMAKGDNVSFSFKVLFKEVFRALKTGFNESELNRTKAEYLRYTEQAVAEKDKTESNRIVDRLVSEFLFNDPVPSPEYSLESLKKVFSQITVDDLNKAIKEMVTENSVKLLVSAPEREGANLPTKEQILTMYKKTKDDNYELYVDEVPTKPLLDAKIKPGKITKTENNQELNYTTFELSNGVKIILKPTDFKNDEVLLNANSYGGTSLVSNLDDYFSAENAPSIFAESGIGPYNQTQFAKYAAGKILSLRTGINDFSEYISGQTSPKDMETFFQMIYLTFTDPRLDSDAFKAYIDNSIQNLKNSAESPETAFYDTLSNVMSNYHPRYGSQTLEKINKIDFEKVYKLYKERFSDASDFIFYFAGAFTLETISPLIEKYIASLPTKGIKETWKDDGLTRPKEKLVKNIKKGVEFKSNVVYNYYGDYNYNVKSNIILYALQECIDIRLREVVREEKGGTYGAYISIYPMKRPKPQYAINLGWGCSPDRVEELSKSVEQIIFDMQAKSLDGTYLQKFRETIKRSRETSQRQNYWWLRQLQSINDNNITIEEFKKYLDIANEITPLDIQNAAKQYLPVNKFCKFVLYPEDKK